MAVVARVLGAQARPQARAAGGNGVAGLRRATTLPTKQHHRVVIVGGGTAGLTVAAQLARSKNFQKDEIAVVDPADDHHYQPGWTLAGSGLGRLGDMQRPLSSLIPRGVRHYPLRISQFVPQENEVRTATGVGLTYDYLVVAPGLETNIHAVKGLAAALEDPTTQVTSIYSRASVEQVWRNIQDFRGGTAIFTQPAGTIKCAGAPQKIMWMALSQWERNEVRKEVLPWFATGSPTMFAVPKYSEALEYLRVTRHVLGLFQHNLTSVDTSRKVATFTNLATQGTVEKEFGFLHVVPPQKPFDWVAKSPLADEAGWVDVDKETTQHKRFKNIFSIGDASSLPTSKTAAAISSQAPVLVDNLLSLARGDELRAGYTGYASCPLLTGHDELMLCEFRYGGVPDETFARVPGIGSQDVPQRAFYHLKKDFFPWVYWQSFVRGTWFGRSGWRRPDTTRVAQSSTPA